MIQPKERDRNNLRETQVQDVLSRLTPPKSFQSFPTTREEWREWDKFPEPPLGAPSAGPPGGDVGPGAPTGSRQGSFMAQFVPQVDVDPMLAQQSRSASAAHEDVESMRGSVRSSVRGDQ